MKHCIDTNELCGFIKTTHIENLRSIRDSLDNGKWHPLFPDNWADTAANRALIRTLSDIHIRNKG